MLNWREAAGGMSPAAKERRGESRWLATSLRPENFIPGLIVGFLLGLFVELPKRSLGRSSTSASQRKRGSSHSSPLSSGEEFKMVLVVRQDLKMGSGKIASQCAHAAVGIYEELMQSQRQILRTWEHCGQPKIVVTCKNQTEMNEIRAKAKKAGLPTFTVADAGRTQVAAGSKTVLVVGPGCGRVRSQKALACDVQCTPKNKCAALVCHAGPKAAVDAITRHLRLL